MQQTDPFKTLDDAIKLSYSEIDKSTVLSREEKRKLLFSLYSFRALFDNAKILHPLKILYKYGCCFYCDLTAHPDYENNRAYFKDVEKTRTTYLEGGGVYICVNNKFRLKFDANSELFIRFVKEGKISGDSAKLIEKFDLYDMVYRIVSLEGIPDALKALWYIVFPLIVMVGAPHDVTRYDALKRAIFSERVFKTVLYSKDGDVIFDNEKEMVLSSVHPLIADWYLPYIGYKNEREENGDTRELGKYRYYLNKKDCEYVFMGTERLLDAYPDDIEILLLNVSARVSLAESKKDAERESLLNDTLTIVSDALLFGPKRRDFLLYYKGLCLLGLQLGDEAKEAFAAALEENPRLGIAELMLKALNV